MQDPRHATIPAWPVLVAVQCTLLVSFVTVGVLRAPPAPLRPPEPLGQRLTALDVPAAEAAVGAALARARLPAAAPLAEQEAVAAALEAVASRAGAASVGLTWGAAETDGGLVVQPLTLDARLDPFDLPVLVALLDRWPVHVELRGLDAVSAGGDQVSARLELALTGPLPVETGWLDPRLSRLAPGADAATPAMEAAAELSAWRAYGAALAPRQAESAAVREEALRAWSPLLVRLRSEGGRLSWAPGEPSALD